MVWSDSGQHQGRDIFDEVVEFSVSTSGIGH
jgi:hypothetical protein